MLLLVWTMGVAPEIRAQQVPTTIEDFFRLGTQPDESMGEDFFPIIESPSCEFCHSTSAMGEIPIFGRWKVSMMANATRDPLFHACMAIAEQDAAFAGDLCLRCHTPGGWLAGRSDPTDGSGLLPQDFDGINCNFCHRAVNPIFEDGVSPIEDQPILDALEAAGLLPFQPGGAGYVVDPDDTRRGPLDDVPKNFHGVPIIVSPWHSESEMCGTCHDVSNPVFDRQPDGTYALNTLGAEHATQDKYDMFPIERTYSEWALSDYATIGVDANGVFGGNHPTGIMHTCQDCHMPDIEAKACGFEDPFFVRPDVPAHDFNGGNLWMQNLLFDTFPEVFEAFYEFMQPSLDRTLYMLQHAATMEIVQDGCKLGVRITNETGHKLPSGYPEGRRLWLTVRFRDAEQNLLATHGQYDSDTADLTTQNTKVYEAVLGVDEAVSQATGIPVGPGFHFAVNNVYYKDNRIPPRGFDNAEFEAIGAAPVGATYEDGQFWDHTRFHIPEGAEMVVVQLHYQSASKEYITFLRDENYTNMTGIEMYDLWEDSGKSPPVIMVSAALTGLLPGVFGDFDCDNDVDVDDYGQFAECLTGPGAVFSLGCGAGDSDGDGDVDMDDAGQFMLVFDGG